MKIMTTTSLRFAALALATILLLSGCNSGSNNGDGFPSNEHSEAQVSMRAILGPLEAADFAVYRFPDLDTPVATGITTGGQFEEIGTIRIPASLLELDEMYFVTVTGGDDHDADDDGQQDASTTPNHGTIHGFVSGSSIDSGLAVVSIVSELIYQRVRNILSPDLPLADLQAVLDNLAGRMLNRDINGDGVVSLADVNRWVPAIDKDALIHSFENDIYPAISDVLAGRVPVETARRVTGPIIGNLELEGRTRHVATSGDLAAVATDDTRVYFIDLSLPSSPQLLSTLTVEGEVESVVLSSDLAYVGAEFISRTADGEEVVSNRVYIVDISQPESPRVIHALETESEPHSLALKDNILFVADNHYGLKLFDISTPTHPVLLSTVPAIDEADRVVVNGHYAYVSDTSDILIIDFSEPRNPILVNTIDTPIFPLSAMFKDGYAFVPTARFELENAVSRLLVIDVRNPEQATIVATTTLNNASSASLIGDSLYISERDTGLTAVDISNPLDPIVISKYRHNTYFAEAIAHEELLLVAADTEGVIFFDPAIFGRSDLQAEVARIPADGGFNIIDNNIYFGRLDANGQPELVVAQFASTGEIVELGATTTDCVGTRFRKQSNILVFIDDKHKLCTADVSEPMQPLFLGSMSISGFDNLTALEVSGNSAYLSRLLGRVYRVDLSNPANPTIQDTLNLGNVVTDVALVDGLLYVVLYTAHLNNTYGVLSVVDISDPENLAVVGETDIDKDSIFIDVQGDHAVVSALDFSEDDFVGTAQLVDISVPGSPHVSDVLSVGDEIVDVTSSESRFYLSDFTGYVHELEILSGQLRLVSSVVHSDYVGGAVARGDFVAIMDACSPETNSGAYGYEFLRCDTSEQQRFLRTLRLPYDSDR